MARLRGIGFPFRKGSDGIPTKAEDRQVIKDSIAQILYTRLGEMPMLPEFGSLLHQVIFENNNELLGMKAKREVVRALKMWEPRVSVINVTVDVSESMLDLLINYIYLEEVDQTTIGIPRGAVTAQAA